MMMNIRGNRVLDYVFVKNYYLLVVYFDEDMNIYNVLGKFLLKYVMFDLIKNIIVFDVILDNFYFLEFESVNFVDRVIFYVDLIR